MHKILREVMMVFIITVIAAMVSCAFIREGKTAQQVTIIMWLITGNHAEKLAKYYDMAACMQDTMQWKGAGSAAFTIVCIDITHGVPYVGR